jgi:hypothetical protein
MAYPPAKMPENADVPGPITETCLEDGGLESETRMVHFDFDATNSKPQLIIILQIIYWWLY